MTIDWSARRAALGSLSTPSAPRRSSGSGASRRTWSCPRRSSTTAPPGSVKDRIYAHMLGEGGGGRPSPTRDDDHRVHDGQRRHRVQRGGRDQGLRLRDRDAAGDEPRADADDRGLRRPAGAHAGRGLGHRPRDRADARDRRRGPRAAYFFPGEFENPDNPEAQEASGEEIWEQTGGAVDAVVAAQGTGGWITGVTSALKASPSGGGGLRGGAGRVSAHQRAALGHARRSRHRRRHHPAEPRPGVDGRHRHREHRGRAGDGASVGPRGGDPLRPLVAG